MAGIAWSKAHKRSFIALHCKSAVVGTVIGWANQQNDSQDRNNALRGRYLLEEALLKKHSVS